MEVAALVLVRREGAGGGKKRWKRGKGEMVRFDTIFFDIGNTLFFFNYEFLREMLAQRFGVSRTVGEIEQKHAEMKRALVTEKLVATMSHDDLWWEAYRRWLLLLGVEEGETRGISEAIRNHPFRHLFWSKMDEGTPETLDWFRERGFKLGVISNAEGQIRRLLEHAHMEERFDTIIDSGVVGFAKPDERIFKHAVERVGASTASCIHVGDLFEVDVVGARQAGITPILVDRDNLSEEVSCLKVRRVADLPKLPIFSDKP